ncbi:MAG: hypothetical protein Q7S20_08150 [Gemmatimonadaceae bacterium]|nr:hypothetical protein [Gemmatimonadaceae bacterium]
MTRSGAQLSQLPTHTATRYVQALREGGSLPAVVETHDGGLFVVKFRGAGQGVKALIAELIVGTLARSAGLPTPELSLIDVPDSFGRSEPDPEIQDLLRASHGTNVGVRYLDGAFNFDGNAAAGCISRELASRLVWFDAFVANPDRTHRNPNLMVWKREPYLIDHGSALYVQHDWPSVDEARTRSPFELSRHHVLLSKAEDIAAADAELSKMLTPDVITDAVASVPDELLTEPAIKADFTTPAAARKRYADYLVMRISAPRAFAGEAIAANARARRMPPQRVSSRR